MNTNSVQNQKGFTLVEIAIVLVIIGLLLGGVLKGQELITNSKIKAVTGDLEGVSAAYYAYQDRTGRLPGDANNDGKIDSDAAFWPDLRTEGFIAGISTATSGPRHDLDGSFVASPPVAAVFGTRNFVCATNVSNRVAQGMDTKLDDGVATTGSIRSSASAATPATTAPTALAAYDGTDQATVICKEL